MTKNKTNTEIITSAYAVADAFGGFYRALRTGKKVTFTSIEDGRGFTATVHNINKGQRDGYRLLVKQVVDGKQAWLTLTPVVPAFSWGRG